MGERERPNLNPPHPSALPSELFELYRNDATTHAALNQWMLGRPSTFEHCLIGLVVQLVRERDGWRDTATKYAAERITP